MSTPTAVVGPTLASTSLAACCGVIGGADDGLTATFFTCALAAAFAASAGTVRWVTVLLVLSQSQALLPFRMRSLSLMFCGTAARKWVGSAYQIRTVCEPVSKEDTDVGLFVPGRDGSPSEDVSTTVPVSGGIEVCPASDASNCAGVRDGSDGAACATEIIDPARTPPTTTTAPAGTAHRARLDRLTSCFIAPCPSFSCSVSCSVRHPLRGPDFTRFAGLALPAYDLRCLSRAVMTLRGPACAKMAGFAARRRRPMFFGPVTAR